MRSKINYSLLIFLITLLFLLLIYYSIYFVTEARYKAIETEVMKDKFNVDQSALNIESVLIMLSKHLEHEAEFHSDTFVNDDYLKEIESSLYLHKPYINSVTRTSKDGIILFTVPLNEKLVGNDISYQEHIKRIMKEQKPVFSDVFMAVQGYRAVALHVPIFIDGNYDGSLAYLISFDHLVDFFKERYEYTNGRDIHWIVSNSGVIIYCNYIDQIGSNLNELLNLDHPIKKEFKDFVNTTINSEIVYEINNNNSHAYFRRINLPFDHSWYIISSITESSIVNKNGFIPVKSLMLSFLLFAILSYVIIKLRTMYIIIKDKEIQSELEKTLIESQRLYKSVLTDMTCMVCRLNESKKIIFFNRIFFERFKYKTIKLKGKDIVEIFNEDEALILNSKIEEISFSNQVVSFEFSFEVNNYELWYFLTIRGIPDEDEKISKYQIIGPDITEYKLSEKKDRIFRERINETEKMAALGSLAAGVAHDFNNILMGIQGNVSLLKLRYDKDRDVVQRLNTIEDQIQNASSLSKQLLGMTKGGKYEITKIDINELLSSILEVFSRSNKNINFTMDLSSESEIIEGDKSQIRQVIMNIILNAIQSISGTGEIEITTEIVEPDSDFLHTYSLKCRRYLKISIKDTGEGMDSEIKSKIFDPFFSTKKKGKGSGLGLASAYGIVKNHDGALLFESAKFVGSVFFVYLPSKKNPEMPGEGSKINNLITGNELILIVDDEKMVLNATADMLAYLGYKSLKAENGEIAIDIFKNNQNISLVILDMILPAMDGDKIFTELKKINPKVKVLISSGYSMSKKIEELLRNGAKGFIEKPFSMEQLSTKVREIIDKD